MLIARPYPWRHYTTARVAEEFESFFLGGWFWLSSAPVAVHVFREVRATTWAHFRLVHQQRGYLLHWSTKNIPLVSSCRASKIKCMLNSRYSGHTKPLAQIISWRPGRKRRWTKNKNVIKGKSDKKKKKETGNNVSFSKYNVNVGAIYNFVSKNTDKLSIEVLYNLTAMDSFHGCAGRETIPPLSFDIAPVCPSARGTPMAALSKKCSNTRRIMLDTLLSCFVHWWKRVPL